MKTSRWNALKKSLVVISDQRSRTSPTMRCYCTLTRQDGVALVLALVAIMLLSMLGLYGAVGSQTDLRIANNDQLSKRVWDVADGGVRHGFRIFGQDSANAWSNGFSDELTNGGTGGSLGSAGGTVTTVEGQQYVFFPFGGTNSTDGYYIRAVDNFDDADQTTDKDQRVLIISRAQVGDAVKVVEALTNPPVSCALTANGDTLLSGNSASANVQVNTLDGNGACVHTNHDLKIQGSVSFPDGASATGAITACNGNPSLAGGGCEKAEAGTPWQYIPTINPGQWAQYVANLGIANPGGPYYILNSRNDLGNGGKITKGGKCQVTDPELVALIDPAQPSTCSPSDSPCGTAAAGTKLGQCAGGIVIAAGSPAPYAAEYNAIAGGGGGQGTINLGTTGVCKVKGLPAGIYYCDGKFDLIGSISGDVTLIARDSIEMQAQSDFVSYVPKTTSAYTNITNQTALNTEITAQGGIANYRTLMGNMPASYDLAAITNLGKKAYGALSNFSLISGQDIKMVGGTQITVQGIIFAHDEVYLSGNKDITGYIMAGSTKPTFPGDPHPPGAVAAGPGDGIEIDTLAGNVVLNFRPFDTLFPLGPPKMVAWHDNMPK